MRTPLAALLRSVPPAGLSLAVLLSGSAPAGAKRISPDLELRDMPAPSAPGAPLPPGLAPPLPDIAREHAYAPVPYPDYAQMLQQAGIQPVPGDVAAYLRRESRPPQPAPGGEAPDESIRAWVVGLGDDDYAKREEASESLRTAGRKAIPLLREALKSGDPEIRARAQSLLDEIQAPAAGPVNPLHDAALLVLVTNASYDVHLAETAISVADFWPRFRGTANGKQWMMSILYQGASRIPNPRDARRLRMIDRLISTLETPADQPYAGTAVQLLAQLTGQSLGGHAPSWRRWWAAQGGTLADAEPAASEETVPVELGLARAAGIPSLSIAGKEIPFDGAAEALKAAAATKRKNGLAPAVRVRFSPAVDPGFLEKIQAACRAAGLETIHMQPDRRDEPAPAVPPAPILVPQPFPIDPPVYQPLYSPEGDGRR